MSQKFTFFETQMLREFTKLSQSEERILVKIDHISSRLNAIENILESPFSKSFDKEYYTMDEVCRMLNVSKRTLQRYRSNRMIRYFKKNNQTYYPKADFEKFLSTYSHDSTGLTEPTE